MSERLVLTIEMRFAVASRQHRIASTLPEASVGLVPAGPRLTATRPLEKKFPRHRRASPGGTVTHQLHSL